MRSMRLIRCGSGRAPHSVRGTPQTGEHFGKSAQLRGMQATVQSAAPGDNWRGIASSAYGTANNSQGRALGGLADLDQQLRTAVDRSAEIVTKGRQGLDETRKWVQDMAAQVPAGRNRDMQLLPIASQGLKQVSDLLTSTVTQQNAVAGDIKVLTTRYNAIKGDLPLSPKRTTKRTIRTKRMARTRSSAMTKRMARTTRNLRLKRALTMPMHCRTDS